MADVKLSELVELTAPVTADFILIVDDSESGAEKSKYVTYENLAKALLPPGMVAPFACSTPTGWLQCDGSAVSRSTYANLFAVISTDYGEGNGTTTFNLPDYRGYFLRGYDDGAENDPAAASRTDRGDGTTGDNIGTVQADEVGPHLHPIPTTRGSSSQGSNIGNTVLATFATTIYTDNSTGTETRPINISVNYCIKF